MEMIDRVYYINLNKRTDRRQHIENEIVKMGLRDKATRVEATEHRYGFLGCTKSHIRTLEYFLCTDDSVQTCLILEDDFFIHSHFSIEEVDKRLRLFFDEKRDQWDTLFFTATIHDMTPMSPFYAKANKIFTTSAYCVHKKYAQTLLDNYQNGFYLMSESLSKGIKNNAYCLDVYSQSLQKKDNWFVLYPKIGGQIPSYSDIENRFVDYSNYGIN